MILRGRRLRTKTYACSATPPLASKTYACSATPLASDHRLERKQFLSPTGILKSSGLEGGMTASVPLMKAI
jgi:hypothetical protein